MPQPKKRSPNINWDALERAYVNGDRDLYFYSCEYTKDPQDPTFSTLRAKSYERGWQKKREARIGREAVEAIGKNRALQDEAVQVQILAREQLLDAETRILAHIQAAQKLEVMANDIIEKFKSAIPLLDFEELAIANPSRFLKDLETVSNFLGRAIEIQRTAYNLSNIKVSFEVKKEGSDDEMQRRLEALQNMDQSQLLREYFDTINQQ